MRVTIEQVKAARMLLGWRQTDLADKTNLSIVTIRRLEGIGFGPFGGTDDTYSQIFSALERAGIEFISDGATGVIFRSKKPKGSMNQRALSNKR